MLCFCFPLQAQVTDSLGHKADSSVQGITPGRSQASYAYEIRGIVKDRQTGEQVPFATVFFPRTPIGASTDADGNFELLFDTWIHDTLRVHVLGYETYYMILDRSATRNNITIELKPNASLLNEVVVRAGEDPAIMLIKKVIAAKPRNNPDQVDNYNYEAYTKVEIDLLNLSREQFEMLPVPYIKRFGFIYDNLDTTSAEKPFLPFFLVETLSDFYFQKDPKRSKEYIKANQIRGIHNQSITQYLGRIHLSINPYDNFLPFFDKKYVSPISNAALIFYDYKIIDTQLVNGYKTIQLLFRPQRTGENCFEGIIKIVDSVYALQYIAAQLPNEANLNWVKNARFYQEFSGINDSLWFCTKENLTAELALNTGPLKLPGLIGRKTVSYKNIIYNDENISRIVNSKRFKEDVVVADTARNKTEAFWAAARHDTLSRNEKAIYNMFDTLEQNATYTRFKSLMKVLFTGVKQIGPIEIGPYWNMYSNNIIEGNRFRFSMGTTPKLFKDIYMNGHIAYGTKDERFKYNIGALWLLDRKPRSYLFASYTEDLDQTVNYYDKEGFDNILNIAVRKPGIPFKLLFTKEARVEFYKEYHSGFSHFLILLQKEYDPYDPLPSAGIFTDNSGNASASITKTEIDLRLRYAYKERFLEGNYYRVSLGSKYPIAEVRFAKGFKGLLNSGYDYHRINFTVSDDLKIAPLGMLYINLFAGKYFGTLPYPLLENHPGNENYFYNKYAFNMMNNFEFLSDQYAGANIEHSIGGGIFNYIPGIKKLKLRQFWTAKGVIGSLSDANRALNLNKGYGFRMLEKNPYIEVGTGIENIFRLFRVDFVWRLAPQSVPGEPKSKYFGIFGSIKLNF